MLLTSDQKESVKKGRETKASEKVAEKPVETQADV